MRSVARNHMAVWAAFVCMALLSCSGGDSGSTELGIAAFDSGDYVTALKEFRSLARDGNAEAQYKLGEMYFAGLGVAKDYAKARFWYLKAAQQGVIEAQFNLGDLYGKGLGTPKDHVKASNWYRLAADQGHPRAQFNLGSGYANGQGVKQDVVLAYMWYALSARQGDVKAAESRALLSKELTPAQIADAQKLVSEWKVKGEKVAAN